MWRSWCQGDVEQGSVLGSQLCGLWGPSAPLRFCELLCMGMFSPTRGVSERVPCGSVLKAGLWFPWHAACTPCTVAIITLISQGRYFDSSSPWRLLDEITDSHLGFNILGLVGHLVSVANCSPLPMTSESSRRWYGNCVQMCVFQ